MNNKTSIIWKISKDALQKIFNESNSYTEILKKLGFKSFSANRKTLEKRLQNEVFDLTLFNKNQETHRKNNIDLLRKKSIFGKDDYLIENCQHSRGTVKRFILKNDLLPYKCNSCGNIGVWLDKKISLQLEHKNGINNDNRIENLCFLCPNCHSQTDTWGGKYNKIKYYCKSCSNPIKGYGDICYKCNGQQNRKFEITKNELEKLINENPMIEVGKMLGVSDNSIRMRCKVLGINIPKFQSGHWIKNDILQNITKEILEKDVYNFTIKQLLKKYSCSVKSLKDACMRYDIKLKEISHTTDEEKKLIVSLKKQGIRTGKIAEIVKRDRKVVYEILKKYGG